METDIRSSQKDHPAMSAVIANYNGMGCLPRTIASLKAASYQLTEIIVVDDGSTDGSCEWLVQQHPDVVLIRMEKNTANLAKVRNAGLRAATSRYVFLTDNDIQLQDGCLEELLHPFAADPLIFCATPRLLDDRDSRNVCQDGNGLHFLAVSTGSVRDRPASELGPNRAPFTSFGGGIMMLDMVRLSGIGLFDEGYVHGWADDSELHIRGVLYGYKCVHVQAATCLLEIKQHGIGRAYGQIHNRLRMLLTFYRLRTLLLLSPGLLCFELCLLAGAVAGGFASSYFRAWAATWRERRNILATRQTVQACRTVEDRAVMRSGPFEIPQLKRLPGAVSASIIAVHYVLDVNWWLVCALI